MASNKIYPFGSGSNYTASFTISSSYAVAANYLDTVLTASSAINSNGGPAGLRGSPDICLISAEQYFALLFNSSLQEVCAFPSRDLEALGGSY